MHVFIIRSTTPFLFCITTSWLQVIVLWDRRRNFEAGSLLPEDKFTCSPYHHEKKLNNSYSINKMQRFKSTLGSNGFECWFEIIISSCVNPCSIKRRQISRNVVNMIYNLQHVFKCFRDPDMHVLILK